MQRLTVIGVIPICAGFLAVAQDQTTRTETQTTTWNGMLVDATCEASHTVHKVTTTTKSPGSVTTRTETTRTETVCPATPATTRFGVVTSDGRFIRFDQPSNQRVMQMMRENQGWNRDVATSNPVRVTVVGTQNGDVTAVNSLAPEAGYQTQPGYPPPPPVGEASRVAEYPNAEQSYDVRWHDDHGRLVVNPDSIAFVDLSNGKHSRTWNYAEIRELKREPGKEIWIKPYHGDKFELHLQGSSEMADDVYNRIGDRIAAARSH